MKWITRSHVHVDRVACPWLIRRFIDSEAEFVFVPKSQIAQAVKETGAIPFDAPNLDKQFDIYDALYSWCRLQMAQQA